ncbi:MAG: hypothetical protein JNK79_19370 [Chitinophagaceae bacterium]|nr:hypothetical protein [Chitinophagaceae bacterium]
MLLRLFLLAPMLIALSWKGYGQASREQRIFDSAAARFQRNTHKVVLDDQGKIIPWTTPQSKAYDNFLRKRWNFIKTMVPMSPGPPPRSNYPQYYFYCAFKPHDGILEPDTWMNDVGEKIPNWFESARLYYAYTGDAEVMKIMSDFLDYSLEHGTSPADFSWPNFPYTTTNAGDTLFRGFTSAKRFQLHEIQVDHAGDIGLTYYRMYQFSGKKKFLDAAVNVANTLVAKVRPGTAEKSPWPYRVNMLTGDVVAEYGANWASSYLLLDNLASAGIGKVAEYRRAARIVQKFIVEYPMKTGYWTDGHTDTDVKTNNYKSNLSASNMTLLMLDYPEFNPNWKQDVPKLIKWTEDFFVHRGDSSEPGTMWGANIVGEQDGYIFKMDYQTARYGAECSRWSVISNDSSFKEKAYRSLNWVTYCSDSNGMAFECPLSVGISNWYSDTYGEGPRMFYPAMAAVPEWAPPNEDHILYSKDVLRDISYSEKQIKYSVAAKNGIEFIKTTFAPRTITLNGVRLAKQTDQNKKGYTLKKLDNGDYYLTIKRDGAGKMIIEG